MKVSEIEYIRISGKDLCKKIKNFTAQIQSVASSKELAELRQATLTEQNHYLTMNSLANMRFTLNTVDKFYKAEKEYYDDTDPSVQAEYVKFMRNFLDSPHISGVTDYINPLVLSNYSLAVKCVNDSVIDLLVVENKLETDYTCLMAETMFEYDGEKMPLSSLKKFFTDANRSAREKAYTVCGLGLQGISQKIDDLFNKMVQVRTQIALKLGYDNFVGLGDDRMGRTYDRKSLANFRQSVLQDVVPVVQKLKKQVTENLKIDKFMLYDNDSYFTSGNPQPVLSPTQMFEAGAQMYRDMSVETGKFFEFMLETDAFDYLSRANKWGGGYCTSFIDFKQPFILANFNGTSGDVDVLTHEAGHAFADYMMYKQNNDVELNVGGMETAETHSMSMEFFCYKYISKFFGDRAKEYCFSHLSDALTFIPYGVIVDYFQELVYSSPTMTPTERNNLWLKLEREFRPYQTADTIPYLQEGTRWQYQMHIFENPLYYVDYSLAQTVALQFLIYSTQDYTAAFNSYINLLKKGGSQTFADLVKSANLNSPFAQTALKTTAAKAYALLKTME